MTFDLNIWRAVASWLHLDQVRRSMSKVIVHGCTLRSETSRPKLKADLNLNLYISELVVCRMSSYLYLSGRFDLELMAF